jgi:hypothetical protein
LSQDEIASLEKEKPVTIADELNVTPAVKTAPAKKAPAKKPVAKKSVAKK